MFNKHLLKWVCEGNVYGAHLLAKPKEISVSLCLGFPKACMFLNIGRQRKLEGFPFFTWREDVKICAWFLALLPHHWHQFVSSLPKNPAAVTLHLRGRGERIINFFLIASLAIN